MSTAAPGGSDAPGRVPDLTALALLAAVARTASLAHAAREVGLSVQAATARIRSVEHLVGAPVLARERRGRRSSRLTPKGALLAEWAAPVLAAARDLDAAVGALRPARADEDPVVVAVAPTAAEYKLPGWLVELRERTEAGTGHPAQPVSLVDAEDPATAVRDGDAQIGFVELTPGDGAGALDKLHAATVGSDDLVLVVAPGHDWTGGGPVAVADLVATPLVTRRPGQGARASFEAALAAVPGPGSPEGGTPETGTAQTGPAGTGAGDGRLQLVEPLREVATDAALLAAVRAGAGPAVLAREAVAEDLAAGTLVEVPLAGVDLNREFRAVWLEGTTPRGTARDLLRIATGGRIR
ncbi:LysR substrate-binding domain-containing protein [Pseudonocardia phyllosphaerae]|uniref:LysR substrate-binding domain-containing protein n=1 Tax=Pseudonocardia phyllosphaerae TaxID=3390502 RepID=UPI003978FAFF